MSFAGSKAQIAKLLVRLRDNYPSLFVGSESEWAARSNAYWEKLRRFEVEVIDEACDQATEKYPDRFPTSGQLVSLCKGIIYEREKREREERTHADSIREERETREKVEYLRREIIPNDQAGQQAWIAEGETPFERLAREFEVESKRLNLDPNRASPREVEQRRMQALMRTWDEANEYKPSPPPDWRTSRHQPPSPQAPRESEPGEDG
jgi:hypothetical protein